MADTVPTQQQLTAATNANRLAYDAIHGTESAGGTAGSETVLARIKAQYDKDPTKHKTEYEAALAQYNADAAAYAKTQATKNKLFGAVNAVTNAGIKAKTKADLGAAYTNALNGLTTSQDFIPTKGLVQAQTAYKVASDAFNAYKKAGGTPAPLPNIPGITPIATKGGTAAATGDQLLTGYAITTVPGNQQIVTTAGTTSEIFFVPSSAAGGAVTPYTSIDQARNAVLTAAGGSKGLPTVIAALAKSGFMTKTDVKNGNYLGALDDAIRLYSVNSLQAYQLDKGTGKFPNLNSFLDTFTVPGTSTGPSLAGTKTVTQDFTTSRGRAIADLNGYFMENFGRAATTAEQNDYFTQVVKAEKTSTKKTTSTTDATGALVKDQLIVDSQLGPADYLIMQASVGKKAFPGMDVNKILDPKNVNSGKLANDINTVMSYANEFGIPFTEAQALKFVGDSWTSANPLQASKDRLRQTAITSMPNLADHLKAGGTVKDVADVYANIRSQKLGITIPDSTKDKNVMDAINAAGGLMNQSDYSRGLQADPLWAKTPEAHQATTDFANTILSSFGFGG